MRSLQVQAGLEGGVTHTQTVTNDYISSLVQTPAEFTLLDAEEQEVGVYKASAAVANPNPNPEQRP